MWKESLSELENVDFAEDLWKHYTQYNSLTQLTNLQ